MYRCYKKSKLETRKKFCGISGKVYTKGKELISGANGTIYDVQDEPNLVLKILLPKHLKDSKRKRRFEREVEEYEKIKKLKPELHILGAVDYGKSIDKVWYVMKKGKSWSDYVNVTKLNLERKIELIIQLGMIIKEIHDAGYAHRDIHAGNIIIINNEIYLGDFGLVTSQEIEPITGSSDGIGPMTTKPSWLKAFARDRDFKSATKFYQAVDIYEYVKTAWYLLTHSRDGFRIGLRYNEQMKNIYLSKQTIQVNVSEDKERFKSNGFTLEPLHRFMEITNIDSDKEMPEIDECLNHLKNFKKINQNVESAKIKNRQLARERLRRNCRVNESRYSEITEIIKAINSIKDQYNIEFVQARYQIEDCVRYKEDIISLVLKNNVTLLIKPREFILSEGGKLDYLGNAQNDQDILLILKGDAYAAENDTMLLLENIIPGILVEQNKIIAANIDYTFNFVPRY